MAPNAAWWLRAPPAAEMVVSACSCMLTNGQVGGCMHDPRSALPTGLFIARAFHAACKHGRAAHMRPLSCATISLHEVPGPLGGGRGGGWSGRGGRGRRRQWCLRYDRTLP